jgi:hypothetical protein
MVRGYTSLLNDKDVRQRRRAVRKLFELNEAAALPAFIPLLDDDDEWFRARAADAVRRWLGPDHFEELDSMAASEREEVRRLAAEVALRVESSGSLLTRLSGDGEHTVRLEAWRSILLSEPLAADSISAAFRDPHHSVRRIATQAIERCESSRSALLGVALQDCHRRVRGAALDHFALTNSPIPEEIRAIVEGIADKPSQSVERTGALRLILPTDFEGGEFSRWATTIGDPSASEFRLLVDLLQEIDWENNETVVDSLKSSEAPNLLPRLIRGQSEQWAQELAVEIVADEKMPQMMRLRLLEDAHGRECSPEFLDAAGKLSTSDHELLAQAAASLLIDVELRSA